MLSPRRDSLRRRHGGCDSSLPANRMRAIAGAAADREVVRLRPVADSHPSPVAFPACEEVCGTCAGGSRTIARCNRRARPLLGRAHSPRHPVGARTALVAAGRSSDPAGVHNPARQPRRIEAAAHIHPAAEGHRIRLAEAVPAQRPVVAHIRLREEGHRRAAAADSTRPMLQPLREGRRMPITDA